MVTPDLNMVGGVAACKYLSEVHGNMVGDGASFIHSYADILKRRELSIIQFAALLINDRIMESIDY